MTCLMFFKYVACWIFVFSRHPLSWLASTKTTGRFSSSASNGRRTARQLLFSRPCGWKYHCADWRPTHVDTSQKFKGATVKNLSLYIMFFCVCFYIIRISMHFCIWQLCFASMWLDVTLGTNSAGSWDGNGCGTACHGTACNGATSLSNGSQSVAHATCRISRDFVFRNSLPPGPFLKGAKWFLKGVNSHCLRV